MVLKRRERIHYHPAEACSGTTIMGDLFPDFLQLERNTLNRGRVFSVFIAASGLGVQAREMTVDPKSWELCVTCPNLEKCLAFSTAKLNLQQALLSYH